MRHLAIMDKNTIDMILKGEKVVESRFSKNKISPFNKVRVGETIYLKESGKNITVSFEVKKVIYFNDLSPIKLKELEEKYNSLICAPKTYWDSKHDSKYGTLMYIKNITELKTIKIRKKGRQGFISFNDLGDLL